MRHHQGLSAPLAACRKRQSLRARRYHRLADENLANRDDVGGARIFIGIMARAGLIAHDIA